MRMADDGDRSRISDAASTDPGIAGGPGGEPHGANSADPNSRKHEEGRDQHDREGEPAGRKRATGFRADVQASGSARGTCSRSRRGAAWSPDGSRSG